MFFSKCSLSWELVLKKNYFVMKQVFWNVCWLFDDLGSSVSRSACRTWLKEQSCGIVSAMLFVVQVT